MFNLIQLTRSFSINATSGAVHSRFLQVHRVLMVLLAGLLLCAPQAEAQAVAGTLTVGTSPDAVAVNPMTNVVYVANRGSNSVMAINGITSAVTATVAVGSNPYAVAVNPVTNMVYTANRSAASVSVINGSTNAVTATVTVGNSPSAVVVNELTNQVYVANSNSGSVSVIDGVSNTAKSITVGTSPLALAVNSATNRIYVANAGSNTISVIDGVSGSVVATVPVGSLPSWLAVNVVTNQIYVANRGDGTSTVIDGVSNGTTSVAVGASPWAVAVNPVTNQVYVTNDGGTTVSVIDGASRSVVGSVTVGTAPAAIAINSTTNQIYVTNSKGSSVSVINGVTNAASTVAVGSGPLAIAVNPVTNMAYVANLTGASVSIIDGAVNAVASVTTGTAPTAIGVNTLTNTAYVANKTSGTVTVINGATNATSTLTAGAAAWTVAINPVTNMVYIGNETATVTVVNGATNTVTATIPAGSDPWAIATNPMTNMVYVANEGSASMTAINGASNAVAATVPVGKNPVAVAVNPKTNMVYIANETSGTVSVIDGATNAVVATLTVGTDPWAFAVDSVGNKIYVANEGSKNVSVIDGATNTVIKTVTVGTNPWALALDPATDTVYVADYGSNSVSMIAEATNTVTKTITVGTNPAALDINPITHQVYVANKKGNTVTVIDGSTYAVTAALTVGSMPASVVVNPVTGQIYVGNGGGTTVSVIDAEGTQGKPLVPVSISASAPANDPLTVAAANTTLGTPFITMNMAPEFTATVTDNYTASTTYSGDTAQSPANPPLSGLYYQIDSGLGVWTSAALTSATGSTPATFNLPLSAEAVGVHTLYLYATYGDEGVPDSSGNASGNSPEISNVSAVSYVVAPQPTTTKLTADINPQDVGLHVTLTASVSPASGTGTPTGSVNFYDSITGTPVLIGTGTLSVVNGTDLAELQTSFTTAGSHAITAAYRGDASFASSTASLTETINEPLVATQTIAALTMSMNQHLPAFTPVVGSGGAAPLSYSVSPTLPAGLSFATGSGAITGAPSVISPATTYTVLVTDANGSTVNAVFSLTIVAASGGAAAATVMVTPSPTVLIAPQSTTVTVTVSGSGISPTGIVTLTSGSYFAQQPLSSGVASFNIPATSLNVGSDMLTASYAGDGVYAAASGQGTVLVSRVLISIPPVPAVPHGSSVSVTATLTGDSTYQGTINLTCVLISAPQAAQNLPTCSFSPSGVTLSTVGASVNTTLTINTEITPINARNEIVTPLRRNPWMITGEDGFLASILICVLPGKRRRMASVLALLLLAFVATTATGCGGSITGGPTLQPLGGATTPGTYIFTVTGVDTVMPTITTNLTTVTVTVQ